jgi:small subunit ribosomal protein S4
MKLFLKGDRCHSPKCAFDRRGYPPGQHGQRRRGKISDYGIQLREKQKVKRMYGLSESQFRLFFRRADQRKGITGTNLLVMLEIRLDNVIYRLGFANSRDQGRQLVRHGHVMINGRRVDIPSYQVKIGDAIEIRKRQGAPVDAPPPAPAESGEASPRKRRKHSFPPFVSDALDAVVRRGVPQWLELDKDNLKGIVRSMPVREDLTMPMQEQLIVELYSK